MTASGVWPSSARFDHKGLWIAGHRAEELADRHGTPLVVIDEDDVRERCRAHVRAFGRALWAVKAFPAQALIRIAADEGLGLLASTWGEVDTCLRAGIPPARVVLHGNNKLDDELDRAVAAGVGMIILDNEEEVGRLDRAAAAAGVRQPALLRIAPAVEVEAHAYVTTGAADTKFGTPVAEGMALRALRAAHEAGAIDLAGVHLHVGSQLLGPEPYLAAIDVALDLLAEAKETFGLEARILDTGGGMGTRYTDEEPPPPEELASAIRERVAAGCRERGLDVPELIGEPGRAISSGTAVTLYRVGTIKEVPGIRTYLAVDGGMSDNLRPALYGARYTFALASRGSEAPSAPFTVVGRHCESGDVLATDVPLPADVVRGDVLAVASTGAYEYAMASTYNKVGRPEVLLVSGGTVRTAIRRETLRDLARLDAGPAGVDTAPPPHGVEIRPARPRDTGELVALFTSIASEGRFIRTERVQGSRSSFRKSYRRSWTRDQAHLVATAGGRVVGHLGAMRAPHPVSSHVASLGMGVRSDHRGRGVGAALLAEAIRWARWAGIEKLTLEVYPHNERALALYRRFGFVEEGYLRGQSKKAHGYEDEIVMARWV